jgi:adenylate cyclase
MSTEDIKRKLTAIFSADVEGYSRLMGDNELATVQTLTSYKGTMRKLIIHYRGRVVDSTGDNLLAEFASVVDAVQCAVEVQQVLKGKNENLPENRRMLFRIGINLGDVIEEDDRIFGDGVNIAARIESLSEGGGVCISGNAYEQIENKLALGYQYMGEHAVKNIAKPIKVYKVPMEPGPAKRPKTKTWKKLALVVAGVVILGGGALAAWHFYLRPAPQPAEVSSEQTPAPESAQKTPPPPVPAEPSIAVLPFANISGDPKQDYLSDGITEQIITALSITPKMLVIARNSSFIYKGKPVMVQQVSEELGVRYVLEGSVQRSGDRLRVTAQLIDAKTRNHIWSDRYDREMKDLFAIQDEITMRVIEGLRVKLTEGEQGRIYSRGTNNLEAYLKLLRGFDLVLSFRSKEDNALGRQMYEEAIALDPEYSNAYALLAWTYNHDVGLGWTETPKKSIERALEIAQKAISLDESNANAYSALEDAYRNMGMLDKALAAGKQAIALAPNGADTNALHSATLYFLCRNEEALSTINKAIHLNPIPPMYYFLFLAKAHDNLGQYEKAIAAYDKSLIVNPNYLHSLAGLGESYRKMGRYEEAIAALKKVIHLNPNYLNAHVRLAASYSLAGQEEKAHAEAKEVLRINPEFSVDGLFAKDFRFTCYQGDQKDVLINALRKAGLK